MEKLNAFVLLIFISFVSSLTSFGQHANEKFGQQYSADRSRGTGFELGLHYGPVWTIGSIRKYAEIGQSFGLNLGARSGQWYWGTEFTITSWKDYNGMGRADRLNFEETNFLWLIHAKYYLGDGKVKPYIGFGTDPITLFVAAVNLNDDDCDSLHCDHEDDHDDFNAWFVPAIGVQWEIGANLKGNLGFTANFSNNYDYIRIQLGIVF